MKYIGPQANEPEVEIVLGVGEKYGIDEATLVYTSKIDVKDWVVLKSIYSCSSLSKGKCPTYRIDTDRMRNILREYKRAILVAAKTKTNEDLEGFRNALIEMEKKLLSRKFYRAFAIVPGCGEIGEESQQRPCLEGTGIDIFALVRKYKKNIEPVTPKKKAPESYGLILLD